MLEKIKDLLNTIKGYVIWVVAPVAVIGGYIYYLLTKISSLQSKVATAKAEKQVAEVLTKREEAKHEADNSELDYAQLRAKYLSEHGIIIPDTDDKPKP